MWGVDLVQEPLARALGASYEPKRYGSSTLKVRNGELWTLFHILPAMADS